MAPIMPMLTLSKHYSLEPPWTQTLSSLIESCSTMKEAKQIHALMFKTGHVTDAILASKLLAFCSSSESGNLAYAQMIFDGLRRPNTFMWNSMIRGCSKSNEPEEALLLYYQMVSNGVPHNSYTFPFVLKACSSLSALEEAQQVHAQIIKVGFLDDIYANNSLLHVLTRCGCIRYARLLFDKMPQRDVVSWNSMIDGCMKCGDIEVAYELFEEMPIKSLVSWTSMISGLVGAGLFEEALNLFREMQSSGFEPDNVVLASALSACAYLGELDRGSWLHSYILNNGVLVDQVLGCAIINMYAKCGKMEEAIKVFEEMEEKDVFSWTAIIDGIAVCGQGREALAWFVKMQKAGVKPNEITFTAILTACSYAGLVEEGIFFFKNMKTFYNLNPSIEHFGCMVDLLGRAGLLEEAEALIKAMPMKANAVVLGSLLKACSIHRDIELGKQIGRILIELEPDNDGRYIHLSSILALEGEWEKAAQLRKQMHKLKISKGPGCSGISLNGSVHEFASGDVVHPQKKRDLSHVATNDKEFERRRSGMMKRNKYSRFA